MNNLVTDRFGFFIGPLIPIDGLEGETILVHKNQIAALSPSKATWHNGSTIENADLPFVTVPHARWSNDGKKIFIGTGSLNVFERNWEPNALLSNIVRPNPPGLGGLHVKTVSWNCDGRHAAVLIAWDGPVDQADVPPKILVYDLFSDTGMIPVIIPVENGEDVMIINSYVVVIAPEITIWTFNGEAVAKLTPTKNTPFRISVGPKEDYLAMIDSDWSIRVFDAHYWVLKAVWDGQFRDIVNSDQGLIALDLEGHLHAACFSNEGLKPIGTADTGLLASRLAITNDERLIIMGNGEVAVHAVDFKLNCGNPD